MLRIVAFRVGNSLIVLWIVSLLVFTITALIPGEPAYTILGENATPEQVETVNESLGLNDPLLIRYLSWLGSALVGDLGTSLFSSQSVLDSITSRLGASVSLILTSLVVSMVVGTILGTIAARNPGGKLDRVILFISSIGIAMPNFWLGLLLITLVTNLGGFLPTGGYTSPTTSLTGWMEYMVLPVMALAAGGIAEIARQARASIVEVESKDFIRTLHAKGIHPRTIERRHTLKNALIPVITVGGLQVNRMFGMSILIETVFRISGIGSLLVDSVFSRDITMVQGTVLLVAAVVIGVNLLVDLSYRFLDPRAA